MCSEYEETKLQGWNSGKHMQNKAEGGRSPLVTQN